MPCRVKCIYDLPSFAQGWLHPKYTSGCIPLTIVVLTLCRDAHSSQFRSKPRGRLCVGFSYSLLDPGMLNNPVLLILDSGFCKPLAHNDWYLLVSLHLFLFAVRSDTFLSSWEFFTTLDYEWRVIRGRLPCRYTIWVRKNRCITGVSG
jgi:hypothetical protein